MLITVGEAGEQALLKEIAAILGPPCEPSVLLGFGDDAAVLAPSGGMQHLLTCDAQVEGIQVIRHDLVKPGAGREITRRGGLVRFRISVGNHESIHLSQLNPEGSEGPLESPGHGEPAHSEFLADPLE